MAAVSVERPSGNIKYDRFGLLDKRNLEFLSVYYCCIGLMLPLSVDTRCLKESPDAGE